MPLFSLHFPLKLKHHLSQSCYVIFQLKKKTLKFKDQLNHTKPLNPFQPQFEIWEQWRHISKALLKYLIFIDLNQFLSDKLGNLINNLLDVGRIHSALASKFAPNLKFFSFAFYGNLKTASSSAYSFSVDLCLRKVL